MKILITGGAGFIGSNFIFYMMDRHPEYEFVCVDKLTYAGSLDTIRPVLDRSNFDFIRRIYAIDVRCIVYLRRRGRMWS